MRVAAEIVVTPCSDFMEMLRCLINCRFIIIIIN